MHYYDKKVGASRQRSSMDIEPAKVLETVRKPQVGLALLNHRRNKLVVNTSGAYYYLNAQGKYCVLSGLLPRLRSVFWQHSNYFRQLKAATRVNDGGVKKSKGKHGGKITGSRVHKQMRDVTVLDAKNFAKQYRSDLHPYCRALLCCLVEQCHWSPFLAEHDIYDEELGIGTSVDGIFVNSEGQLQLLEYKTGYRDYFETPDGEMKGALQGLPNTVLNQATLQIMTAALILEKRYDIPLSAMNLWVIRIDEREVEMVPVPEWFVKKRGQAVYGDLLKFQQSSLAKEAKKSLVSQTR
jgi:hypothetical protein